MAIILNRTAFLDTPITVEPTNGVVFSNENKGHQFVISCIRGGELQTLTGTVTARFMRANNTTILIAGNNYTGIVDGKAVVTLPQDCYNVPGRFQMTVFLTADGATSCIYACAGSVQRTQSGELIDSGEAVPSLNELLAQIDACEQATADAQEAASHAVRYTDTQTLTDDQKSVARNNISAASENDVADLKSALVIANVGNVPFAWNWEIGNVSSVGGDSSDNKTIRTVGRYPYDGQSYVQFTGVVRGQDDTVDRIAYVYPYDASGIYMGSASRMLINDGIAVKLPDGAASYRLTYGYTSASGKTVADLASMVADYGLDIISVLSHDVKNALELKQDVLEFDVVPTSGSINPVTSGGVYDANKALESDLVKAADTAELDYLLLLPQPAGETYRNVTYTWTGMTCHVVTGDGGASNTSYTDVFADPSVMPDGIKPGRTYRVLFDSENVQLRLYYAENNTFNSTSIYNSNRSGFVDIPATATGMRARLYVASGAVVDEYVTPTITRVDVAERIVFPHKVAMFGDSIMVGRNGNESSGVHTPYTIPSTIAARLGIICDNYGVSGQGYLATTSSPATAYDNISSVDLSSYDTIIMCYGVNDGFHQIGDYNSTDETVVMGQFNKIINYIFTQKPAVRVIVIAPYNGCNAGTFPKYWYGNVGSSAYSRGTLSDTLKQACEYYNIPYIEQKNSPLNGFTVKKDILDTNNKSLTYMGADGVHPSNAGYKALGGWLSGEIARLIG